MMDLQNIQLFVHRNGKWLEVVKVEGNIEIGWGETERRIIQQQTERRIGDIRKTVVDMGYCSVNVEELTMYLNDFGDDWKQIFESMKSIFIKYEESFKNLFNSMNEMYGSPMVENHCFDGRWADDHLELWKVERQWMLGGERFYGYSHSCERSGSNIRSLWDNHNNTVHNDTEEMNTIIIIQIILEAY